MAKHLVGILGLALLPVTGFAQDAKADREKPKWNTTIPIKWAADAKDADAVPAAKKQPYFWFGMWPDFLGKFDPRKDEVVQKIKLRHGVQWGRTLSHDKTKFFVVTDQKTKVEVVDIVKGEVVEVHDFHEDGWIVRVSSVKETPGYDKWYVRIDRVKRELDHFVIKTPQYLLYNVAEKKVEKRMDELPKAIRSGARISPDGKKWHVISGDIKIVDPKTLKEEAKIDLTTPQYTGTGAIRVYGSDFYDYENPEKYKMLYRMTDPINSKRRVFGIVEISLKDKKILDIEEWGPSPDFWSFYMSDDKKFGAAQGRGSNGTSRVALFDMTNGKMIRDTYEKFRPRRSLSAISPDGKKLYVGGAGSDFLVFDQQLERVKTVWLDGEIMGRPIVIDG